MKNFFANFLWSIALGVDIKRLLPLSARVVALNITAAEKRMNAIIPVKICRTPHKLQR